MTTVTSLVRSTYTFLVPKFVRRSAFVNWLRPRLLSHDWIYDADYYKQTIEGPAVRSSGTIAHSIVTEFQAKRVIDVGCGTGALLEALRSRGCEVCGLEYSAVALEYCRSRQLDVEKFDLEHDSVDGRGPFDVAVSMEVAEHLPQSVADRYVSLLTRLSRVIVFTAATPGQGGADHVNEQPPEYWIGKFRQQGFEYAEALTHRWRAGWKAAGDVEAWYHQNLLVFVGSENRPSV